MHTLFSQVLIQKNLSKAGDLFSLEDHYIIGDLPAVLEKIQDIVTQPNFLTNHNDQSLVEICITRLTSAIRETGTIEQSAPALVALLDTCLCYSLRPETNGLDPPHAKIASDVMSCIFLNYSKRHVMELALPVSVKFLHKGNKELSRNMSSYLSLAAIEHADLLARHLQPVIDSVIAGNYSLARVLPTVYAVNRQPINSHAMTLVSILHNCDKAEKLALLSLFSHIAKDNPNLLESSVPQLCESLMSQSTAASALQVFYNVALAKPQILSDHLKHIKATAENQPKTALTAIQVLTLVAKSRKEKAQETMDFILSMLGRLESDKHTMVLKEIISLVHRYPHLLTPNVVNKVSNLEDGASSATRSYIHELRNELMVRSSKGKASSNSGGGGTNGSVTIVKVGGESIKGDERAVAPTKAQSQHIYQQQPARVTSSGSRNRLDKAPPAVVASAATGMTPTSSSNAIAQQQQPPPHRSMTKLSAVAAAPPVIVPATSTSGVFDSKTGIHKSLTRLNTSQQNMSRYNSSSHVQPPQVARSATCITNNAGGHYYQKGRITLSMQQGPGASSPTKSMSSGSVSGVTALADGREILTVNVEQINADLMRQASTVLSQHGGDINELPPVAAAPMPTASYTHIAPPAAVAAAAVHNGHYHNHHHHHGSNPHHLHSLHVSGAGIGTANGHYGVTPAAATSQNSAAVNAPFSLPSHSSRRAPPYNSGPLPTLSPSQPASLGIPLPHAATAPPPPPLAHQPPHPLPPPPQSHQTAFSNTLPSPRRRANRQRNYSVEEGDDDDGTHHDGFASSAGDLDTNAAKQNRISVFEPYPMRDTVQHFCEKHLAKIKSYMSSLGVKLPLPVKCAIEERKGRKHAKLHFACQGRAAEYCLYRTNFYTLKTRHPRPWIHLMFLALQARSGSALSTREASVSALKHCWEILKAENISFVTLVTGAFPNAKEQDTLLHELRAHRFFDVFEYNGPAQHWGCFLCNHPDRARDFIQESEPVIEGQLKEKKGGRWKLFKKWKSRYFTLSGAKLTYKDGDNGGGGGAVVTQTLDVGSIRSVKVSKEGRRNIPKAFEIFTHDRRAFVLKAKDGSNAQEWMQCLSVAKAHSQSRDSSLRKLAYAGSLGRLNQHHGRASILHSMAAAGNAGGSHHHHGGGGAGAGPTYGSANMLRTVV